MAASLLSNLENELERDEMDLVNGNIRTVTFQLINLLSKRELQVVEQLYHGKSNADIGTLLRISPKTVKFHLTNIYLKTKSNNRLDLMVKLRSL